MFELSCKICSETFEAKTMFSNYCSAKCRMKHYRSTIKGKQSYQRYNQKHYKRPTVELTCQLCGNQFNSTRKNKTTCNKIKCKSKAAYLAQLRQRLKHPEKARASDIVNKRIKRKVSLFRQPCSVCSKPNAEAHHKDYSKPLDITWLCKQCHTLEHKAIKMMDISLTHTMHIAMSHNNSVGLCI